MVENSLIAYGPYDRVLDFYNYVGEYWEEGESLFSSIIPIPDSVIEEEKNCKNSIRNWCVDHWGIPGPERYLSMANTYTKNKKSYVLYTFETDISAPLTGLFTASKKFPNVMFHIQYLDRTEMVTGVARYINGVEMKYDQVRAIPSICDVIDNLWGEFNSSHFSLTVNEG